MFYYIEGTVANIAEQIIVIDVSGVGYLIHTSSATLSCVKPGNKSKVYTYVNVKEDAFDIFGFLTLKELEFFKKLISINGVGPKAALSILSVADIDTLTLAVISGDEGLLTKANGIGKKIASRIVLELKDKVLKSGSDTISNNNTHIDDAMDALTSLGFTPTDTMAIIMNLDNVNLLQADDIIKQVLKKIGG